MPEHEFVPTLLTLESWSGAENIVSHMPDIPVYPNKITEEFMEMFYNNSLSYYFDTNIKVSWDDDCGVHIYSQVTIPNYEIDKSSTFIDRLQKFIKGELNLIEHGY